MVSAYLDLEIHTYIEDKGVILSREQCRRAKFQVKSITHSVTKLLKLQKVDQMIAKELNLILDFCGRIMNDLQQTSTITSHERRPSDWNSLSSEAVENLGAKGLQTYKELSEGPSYVTAQVQRSENNRTEMSMKIEDQIQPYRSEERVSQVKTSHSQSRNRSNILSPSHDEEYRIRQINHDLMMNSKELPQECFNNTRNVWRKEPT